MNFLDLLEAFIKRCEREVDACERGDEDAMWRSGFLNLTVISVVVIAAVVLVMWWV